MRKITENDLKGKGNIGRPDIPGVSTAEMQRILDELAREVIVPAFNELSGQVETAINERYTKSETDEQINQRVLDIGTGDMARATYDPQGLGTDVTVQQYTCTKSGNVYALNGNGAIGRCKIPATWTSGDTWTVNGKAAPAYCGADAVDGDCIVAGRWVLFTFDGARLDFNGGGGLSNGKLAQATASEAQVLAGQKFYAGGKTLKTGTMRNNGSWPTADKLTLESGKLYMYKQDGYTQGGLGVDGAALGNAGAGNLLAGVSASSKNGLNFAGGMPNRGAWSTTISPGGNVTIPAGYHNGSGIVAANTNGVKNIRTATKQLDAQGGSYRYTITEGTLIGVTGISLPYASSQEINPGVSVWMSGNQVCVDVGHVGGYVTISVTYAYY